MKFKGYRYTFRFNASHCTSEDGSIHNHTFEMSLYINAEDNENDTVIYKKTEAPVNEFISRFADKLLNDVPPFDKTLPTLENMAEYAYDQLYGTINESGYKLQKLEISDSPNNIYYLTEEEPDKVTKKYMDLISEEMKNKPAEEVSDAESVIVPNPIKPEVAVSKITDDNTQKSVLLENEKPLSFLYFFLCLMLLCVCGAVITILIRNSGFYPLGLDIHGHLFKSDLMYESIKQGNFYPLYSEYWYNGIQPFRYWPPMPYYFMSLLQFIAGGNVMNAYLLFIFSSFVIGGTGWLLFARKLHRPVLGIVLSLIWFFLPDNLRVFFGEGNLPRMFITMLLPLLFYFIWQFVCYKRKAMVFPTIITMVVCIFGHLMISAMIGVLSFIFMLIYAIANKEYKYPLTVILSLLFSFAVCGIWVYPALMGGIVSMESDGNNELMASLAGKLIDTLNPVLRLGNGITELYLGLAIVVIAVIGLIFSNRKSIPGFLSLLLIVIGTTTAMTPIIQQLPFSQLFWIRRFLPIAYCVFFISMFEWKKIKKPVLIIMCILLCADCIPSLNLSKYDIKMNLPATVSQIDNSLSATQIDKAKEITDSRSSVMDISMFGPMPSYAYGTLDPETPYVFGWAWQGAATAENIVNINEAYEKENFEFMFDRNLELGADTVIVNKPLLKNADSYDKLVAAADKVGYTLVSETDLSALFKYDVNGTFGTITDYNSIAIGSNANLVQMMMPSYRKGNKLNIDDYTYEELSSYQNVYLSGFFYNNKQAAENLVNKLSESGCNIYIDMNHIPADPVTNRMTFLGVSAQPVTFTDSFPELITDDEIYSAVPFDDKYKEWNTVYLTGLKNSAGSVWFKDTKLDFAGRSDNDRITYIGLNILFHAYTSNDENVLRLLQKLVGTSADQLPERHIVPIEVSYSENKVVINSDYDNVNTTIAYQDTFYSDKPIRNEMNLLQVDKGTTVIDMHYPYLVQGIAVTVAGLIAEILLIMTIFRKHNKQNKALNQR